GTEGASDAHVSKGKEPVVSDIAVVGIAAATPKRIRADKEKFEKVVVSTMTEKKKIPKKQRTQKKKAPKVMKKMVVQEEDEEETDEEPLQCKRKRAASDKGEPAPKRMNTEAETVAEGIKIAAELQKNKSKELSSLFQELSQTQPPTQTLSQHSSPLEILESHLQGELPQSPRPSNETSIPTTRVFHNIFSSTERLLKPTNEFVFQSTELEKSTSEAEVETSPASEEKPSEQPTSEQIPQPIPEQTSEQIPADPVKQNYPKPDLLAKFENFQPDFSHQNLYHDIHPSHHYQP
ncbi:hypothetical protein A2U01_0017557, partial [Trifolium medium]|nr:hypothetical protein [Trifolium medium]